MGAVAARRLSLLGRRCRAAAARARGRARGGPSARRRRDGGARRTHGPLIDLRPLGQAPFTKINTCFVMGIPWFGQAAVGEPQRPVQLRTRQFHAHD
ncbi:MAG: hypothetical protein ACK559_13315, partial [bacterium]